MAVRGVVVEFEGKDGNGNRLTGRSFINIMLKAILTETLSY